MTDTPYRHILVAVDGSEHAVAGVQAVREMPLPPGSRITVLSAFLPRCAGNLKLYENSAHQAAAMLADKHAQVTEEVLAGAPAEVISSYAQAHKADLIVMGARGQRSAFNILLGGVAQQVVEYAHCPVLVLRAPYHGFKRALFVSDGSPCSRAALAYLGRLPLPVQERLDLLHVLPPPPIPQSVLLAYAWPVAYDTGEALQAQDRAEIEQILAQEEVDGQALVAQQAAELAQLLALHGSALPVETSIRRGDAAEEILTFINEHQTDLVVAGSRGLSAVRGWLLGSVSRKLLHYAPCSVLVVRALPCCVQEEEVTP